MTKLHRPASSVRLLSEAKRVAEALRETGNRIIFAESCTAGLIAATLGRIPGISEHLCGSAVVYRNDTKEKWLSIPRRLLKNPGPVSRPVALAMAKNVLEKTPEATLSAAITGHLGPGSAKGQDGLVFIAFALRGKTKTVVLDAWEMRILPNGRSQKISPKKGENLRFKRQVSASHAVLFMVRSLLKNRNFNSEA